MIPTPPTYEGKRDRKAGDSDIPRNFVKLTSTDTPTTAK